MNAQSIKSALTNRQRPLMTWDVFFKMQSEIPKGAIELNLTADAAGASVSALPKAQRSMLALSQQEIITYPAL